MIKYWVMSCSFLLLASLTWAVNVSPRINLEVQVVDALGEAIEGAQVGVAFPGRISGEGESFKKLTDKDGRASFSGSSFLKLKVRVEKEGYYDSHQEVKTFERVNRENVYSDQDVRLVLREIQNPVAMYSYQKVLAKLPVLGEPVGFDMMKADWVSPYGQGVVADILLEITGDWNGYRDHDSLLKLSFPNPGDGYVTFDANEQSRFRSPYEAPSSGYVSTKSWRKMKRPVEGAIHEWDAIDEASPNANYILRVRAALDADGEVEQAHYAKMYGDFEFWGATLDDKYGYVVFSYYLNPTANDRSLESDPSRNLIEGLGVANQPKDP